MVPLQRFTGFPASRRVYVLVMAGIISATQALVAQTIIPIPPVLTGSEIDLIIQKGSMSFFPGVQTQTIGYNGSHLGPTILLEQGQQVTLHVHNQLDDTTTTHWHGLHVAPSNDGSPHTPILPGETWSPSFTIKDQAATYWYHPHPHGKTLQQVVKGAAGLIIVKDAHEASLELPRQYGVDDIPLVFQWQTFDNAHQIVPLDEADNDVLVNSTRNGLLELPAQVVRLRLLNGSSHRYFHFGFSNALPFRQIASDAGLLDAPVSLTRLTLAPGERAEVLLDLSGMEGNTLTWRQYGTGLPSGYPGGAMMMGGMMGPKDNSDFDLLTLKVVAATANPVTSIPATLATNTPWSTAGASSRTFGFTAQPMMSMTNFFINGAKFDMETINFTTEQGRTEVWTITNQTMMAHPFHVHGNSFYVLAVNGSTPPAQQRGRKDVITVPPMNGSVKLILRFEDFGDAEMPYMYHCHILSHEDTGMMGQFIVNPAASSVAENTAQQGIRVYPSLLSSDQSVLHITGERAYQVYYVEIFDAQGRLLFTQTANGDIPGSRLAAGFNCLKVYTPNGTAVFSILKTN